MEICDGRKHEYSNLRYSKPCDVPNLALWLDANDVSTMYNGNKEMISGENNEPIEIWRDKSENGLDAKVGSLTDANRPKLRTNIINNKNAISFNQNLVTTNTRFLGNYPFSGYQSTSFCVYKTSAIGGGASPQNGSSIYSFTNDVNTQNRHFYGLGTSATKVVAIGISGDANVGIQFPFYVDLNVDLVGIDSLGWAVSSVAWEKTNENNVLLYGVNPQSGAEQGIAVGGIQGKYSVGSDLVPSSQSFSGTRFFRGFIGELMIYNRLLKDFEIDLINRYLLFKWGNAPIDF